MIVRVRNPSLAIGVTIVVAIVLGASFGPMLFRADPLSIDLANVLAPPSRAHPFGCDALGRDVLARILWGARLSLSISTVVVAISLAVGSLIGATAALTIALTAMGWTGYARIVRGEVLTLRERDYVVAAESLGASRRRLLLRHLIPGGAGPLAVQATFGIGGVIGAEAALSFLGLGALPPTPSWGNMLDAGRAFLLVAPHLTTAPGLPIGLSILGFDLLGDGIAQKVGHRA